MLDAHFANFILFFKHQQQHHAYRQRHQNFLLKTIIFIHMRGWHSSLKPIYKIYIKPSVIP